ncbi:DUF58 domain-containing protein [Teredinibacter franksiae]|uniref:DUF58 domain-containing protein n=1 Tax=Teredinibacter franksiae TaxID=2761453 RepID=UPI001628D254|nr:DUF58 domain-containing protein [Teredinibacter franksiae]
MKSAATNSPLKKNVKGVYVSIDDMLGLRFYTKDLQLTARKRSSAIADGEVKTHFRGRGMEFAEVRPYQPGDDVRSIDWRVTARSTQAYTKLYQEERERPVLIAVDQRSPMFFGSQTVFKSYATAQMAAAIGWIALQNNDRIGALIFGDTAQEDLRTRRGKHALLALVNRLQDYNHRLTSPIAVPGGISTQEIFTDLRRVAKPGTAVFVISDFNDITSDCEESLHMLAKHTDVTLLKVFDPLEQSLPKAMSLSISNKHDKLTLDTLNNALLSGYEQNFSQAHALLTSQCQNAGATLRAIDISKKIEHHVNDLFASRNKKSARGAR